MLRRSTSASPYTNWLSKVSDCDVVLAALGSGNVVTVDMGGCVRLWETGLDNLQRSLMEWRNMIGSEDGTPIQVIQLRSTIENVCFLIYFIVNLKSPAVIRQATEWQHCVTNGSTNTHTHTHTHST